MYHTDQIPCDNSKKWIYNFHNRKILSDIERFDRCSALVASECDDLGEHLHERHELPESYFLAESTPARATGYSQVDRILWADSEKENNTIVAVQNFTHIGKTRHDMSWLETEFDIGERKCIVTEKTSMIYQKTADFLMSYPRREYTRILASDVKPLMLEWMSRYRYKSWRNYELRKILREVADELASRTWDFSSISSAGKRSVEVFEFSVNGNIDNIYEMITEAVKTADTLDIAREDISLEYLIAKKVENRWSRFEVTEYFKKTK